MPVIPIRREAVEAFANSFSACTQGNARTVLMELLMSAALYDTDQLKKGQCFHSRASIAKRTGLSEKAVRSVLTQIQKGQQKGQKRASKKSVVSIPNYDTYIAYENIKGPEKGQQKGHILEEEDDNLLLATESTESKDSVRHAPKSRQNSDRPATPIEVEIEGYWQDGIGAGSRPPHMLWQWIDKGDYTPQHILTALKSVQTKTATEPLSYLHAVLKNRPIAAEPEDGLTRIRRLHGLIP